MFCLLHHFFVHPHVWGCAVCGWCVCVWGVWGAPPFFFMPAVRGGLVFSCSRIRDYVNPCSGLGCGWGGGGVFVITDSWWRFQTHHQPAPAIGSLHQVHKTHKYSQLSRLHRYVISDIHTMLRTPVSNNDLTRSEILRVDALGVVVASPMTMAKYVQYRAVTSLRPLSSR
ncbi:hypothetical protein FRC0190_02172 [Corynebacterium rouxii]|uniref:Uncharacterized protein n=1 Tax=Corynebacterium rouxii TaxID=2719119 RepID=A0A6I8MIR0_9CORY|nr:hypothetical protein FRC0190_02172 [Corynebacterium rouxii]